MNPLSVSSDLRKRQYALTTIEAFANLVGGESSSCRYFESEVSRRRKATILLFQDFTRTFMMGFENVSLEIIHQGDKTELSADTIR